MNRDMTVEQRQQCPTCKVVPGMACVEPWRPDPHGTMRYRYRSDTHPSRIKAYARSRARST